MSNNDLDDPVSVWDPASMFWERFKEIIKQKDMTQESVAIAIHVRPDNLSRWVQRSTIPKANHAVKIAQVLGVSVEYLVTGKEADGSELSARRRRFVTWVNEMTEDEMESIEALFKVLGSYGEKLGES